HRRALAGGREQHVGLSRRAARLTTLGHRIRRASLVGGGIGAWLLLRTPPERFAALVPWLVLAATGLFMSQPVIVRTIRRRRADRHRIGRRNLASAETTSLR